MDELVTSWIESRQHDVESDEYEKHSWAVDRLYDLVFTNDEQLLKVVTDILAKDDSEAVVGALGAGVLEDLLIEKGDEVIDSILLLAEKNKAFRRCVQYTFIDKCDVSASVFAKISSLKCNV